MYPFSKELQQASSERFDDGNFGLWFYKLVPLNEQNDFKACGRNAADKNIPAFYQETYNSMKKKGLLKKLLEKKHQHQEGFCRQYKEKGRIVFEIEAELKSPLITGIGKTHPCEVGMTFDHTLGIPYLPASGVKGLVRLAHILNLIQDEDKAKILIKGDQLDDSHSDSLIPDIFGGDLTGSDRDGTYRGKAIFLDAYPKRVPELHVDIMNPHYGDYYGDEKNEIPPADYLDPVPIQFLTVSKGTVFIFRAVVTENETWGAPIAKAFKTALEGQGFGAKTAVGYGRFRTDISEGNDTTTGNTKESAPPQTVSEIKIWEGATLTYTAGNKQLSAKSSAGTATVTGKNLVPESYHKKLFDQKKSVGPVTVKVEPLGRNWRIVEIV